MLTRSWDELPLIEMPSLQELETLGGDDQTFVSEILELFIQNTEHAITELELAAATASVESIATIAHSVKGASSHLGLRRIQAISELLEHTMDVSACQALVGQLRDAFSETKRELEAYLTRSS